jgi:hypothetical protein
MAMEMKQVAAECERRAAEFGEKAENSPTSSNRMFFLELEQHWLHLACIYYQADRTIKALRKCGADENSEFGAPARWNYPRTSIH